MCEVNLDKETLFLDKEIIDMLVESENSIASEYPVDFLLGMVWSILTPDQRKHTRASVESFTKKTTHKKERNENPIPSDRSE